MAARYGVRIIVLMEKELSLDSAYPCKIRMLSIALSVVISNYYQTNKSFTPEQNKILAN